FHARLLGRTSVRGEQGCRTLATILSQGPLLGGSRCFLGFRLELLPRLRRLEGAVVARKPVGKRVGYVGYMTSSGRDAESIRQRLDKLEQQLAEAKGKHAAAPQAEGQARGAAYGQALKLATEMIAGVAVGGFIGWALDRLFGSAPLLMVVFLILG